MVKQKYTPEEAIEILRKTVHAYKDDDNFANHVIQLAGFLLDYREYRQRQDTPAPLGPHADTRPWLKQQAEEDAMRIERIKARSQELARETCNLCGANLQGEKRCPRCGNISV